MALLPKVKLKAVVSFPAAVYGGAGVAVRKENGKFYFDLNFAAFSPPVSSIPDATNQNALLWNKVTGSYVLAPVALFGGGVPEAPNDGSAYGRLSAAWAKVLPLAGGTLTGALILAADPGVGLGAATKQYVDAQISTVSADALINRFRGGSVAPELFTIMNGVNEFDLLKVGSTYYFAHDDLTTTELRSASTIAGLSSATPTTPVTGGRVPSIWYEGTTWHLWVGLASDSNNGHHFTAPAFTGPYTDTGQTFPVGYGDLHVRKHSNGSFYMAYVVATSGGTDREMGIMTATSVNGPWTDLGYVFASRAGVFAGPASYADPAVFEVDGRTYLSFATWNGQTGPTVIQIPVILEINPTTGKAISPVAAVADPFAAAWMQRASKPKLFNPVFLRESGVPDRIYYSQNAATAGLASGWGYTEIGTAPNDNRRNENALNINFQLSTLDIASMSPAILHGATTLIPATGLVLTATTGGAYGNLNVPGFTDFTVLVEFTIDTLPADGVYQQVIRLSAFVENNLIGIWVVSNAGVKTLYWQVGTAAPTGTKPVVAGTRYQAVLSRIAGVYTATLNGAVDVTGSNATVLTGMQEWALGNRKGAISAATQQFIGKIHRALIVTGPLRRTGD